MWVTKVLSTWHSVVGLRYLKLRLAEMEEPTAPRRQPSDSSAPSEDEDSFFSSRKRRAPTTDQLERYLADECEQLTCLDAYPKLRVLFIELNTPLPASAACERLFSAAGLIFKPLRACIGDAEFENQLLLKLNKTYV